MFTLAKGLKQYKKNSGSSKMTASLEVRLPLFPFLATPCAPHYKKKKIFKASLVTVGKKTAIFCTLL